MTFSSVLFRKAYTSLTVVTYIFAFAAQPQMLSESRYTGGVEALPPPYSEAQNLPTEKGTEAVATQEQC